MNTSVFLDMYDEILSIYEERGFLNNSVSNEFVNTILHSIDLNEKNHEYSSDEDI